MERDQLQARLDEVKRLRAGAATRALGLERLEHLVGELITEALIARSLDRPSRALQFLYLELGTELCKAERPEHALPLYELAFASARARTPPDRHAATLFGLRRCGCLIELLRFDDAAGALAEALELTEPLEGDAVLAAADRLTLDLHADDGRLLAAEALYWAARWLAAVGRSGAAERLAASLLERVDARPVSTLDVDEVALLLGEVRLDRGDAAGVQSMVEQRRARAVAGGARERWTVLEAICRFRAGELSAAEQSLSTSIAAAALWARAHCLATLNRVDEAEAVVQQLEAQHASRRAIEQARALIAARRTAQPDAIPTPFEILDEELRLTAPRPAPTNAATGRRHARLSDDVAERCNAIQLDLHHDELERAKRKLTELEQWLRAADSPLDLGRLHKIGAQVDYYSGRYADAGSRAERAVAVFAALAQPLDELTAWRIKRWTLERSGDDVARVADALQREAELLFAVRARLTAADRALFMLNKWSVVDEVVSERCADARRLVETAPRSVRRRARVLLRTLHDVSRLRRWEDVRAADALPDVTTKPRERRDLFTAAAEQIAAATRGPSARLPVAALPTRWLPDDTALLHFVVLPNRVELFVLHRAGVELVTPSVSSSKIQLRALLSDALQRITGATRWPGGPETERLLTELPRFLGVDRALETLPRSVKKLCIVPDDLLCNFPFAALRV
ncbi:MAG TPA: hypothetical protein VFF06_34800, partial [Polyangia bacterium]|nr:hypothetical protein [Polyangia bacterium]